MQMHRLQSMFPFFKLIQSVSRARRVIRPTVMTVPVAGIVSQPYIFFRELRQQSGNRFKCITYRVFHCNAYIVFFAIRQKFFDRLLHRCITGINYPTLFRCRNRAIPGNVHDHNAAAPQGIQHLYTVQYQFHTRFPLIFFRRTPVFFRARRSMNIRQCQTEFLQPFANLKNLIPAILKV